VYPQELKKKNFFSTGRFFLHRYQPLLGRRFGMLLASRDVRSGRPYHFPEFAWPWLSA